MKRGSVLCYNSEHRNCVPRDLHIATDWRILVSRTQDLLHPGKLVLQLFVHSSIPCCSTSRGTATVHKDSTQDVTGPRTVRLDLRCCNTLGTRDVCAGEDPVAEGRVLFFLSFRVLFHVRAEAKPCRRACSNLAICYPRLSELTRINITKFILLDTPTAATAVTTRLIQ
jgi:hypothetical protein